jgi:predicted site-specific integrase-resolvase
MATMTGWISPAQAANRLKLSRQQILRLADSGLLRCEMTAIGRLIDPVSVEEEIARRQALTTEKG